MKSGTPELMKFKRLQRMTGESCRSTIGLLEKMWLEVAKNCPAGDIGKFTNEEIAILLEWDGDPDLLVSALTATGWLDESEPHRLVVHDWADHCPKYVKANLVKHGKQFARRASPGESPNERMEPPIGASSGRLPDDPPSKPSLTKPNPTQPREPGSWDGVELALVEIGIGRRETVLSHLRSCGSDPFKVEQILGVWESRKSAFTNPHGALVERLLNEHPGMAADTGWVTSLKRDTGQRKPRDRTLDFEMQRTLLVKSMKLRGAAEDEIELEVGKLKARMEASRST